MERARFFVDGFNFYHSLIENRGFRKEAALDNYDAAILVANDTDLVSGCQAPVLMLTPMMTVKPLKMLMIPMKKMEVSGCQNQIWR
jgi:hypothetical protein